MKTDELIFKIYCRIKYYLWYLPVESTHNLLCKIRGHRFVEQCHRYVTVESDYNEERYEECKTCGKIKNGKI